MLDNFVALRNTSRPVRTAANTTGPDPHLPQPDPGHFFVGKFPPRKLAFGEFLYYRGIISKETLAEAVGWQRTRRPLFGQLAVFLGFLSRHDFARVLSQNQPGFRFGRAARDLGLLSAAQVNAVLKAQRDYNCPLGRYFLEQKILSPETLRSSLEEQIRHNAQWTNNKSPLSVLPAYI